MNYRIFGKGNIKLTGSTTIGEMYGILVELKKSGFKMLLSPGNISDIFVSFDQDAEHAVRLPDLSVVFHKICEYIESGEVEFADNEGVIVRFVFSEGKVKKERGNVYYSISDVFTEKQRKVLYDALCEYVEGNDVKEAYDMIKLLDKQ